LDISEKRGGGFLVLLADGEVKVFELLVEGLGLRGVRTLDFDEVVDVEAEGTDLAAKLVGRLGPVLLADVLTNILVDASLQIVSNTSYRQSLIRRPRRRRRRSSPRFASSAERTTDSVARAAVSFCESFWKEKRDGPSDRGFWSNSKSRAFVRTKFVNSQSRALPRALARRIHPRPPARASERAIREDSSESREIRGGDAIFHVNTDSRALNTCSNPRTRFSRAPRSTPPARVRPIVPGSTHLVDELQPGLVLHALVRELDARRRERGRGRAQDDRRDGGEGNRLCARDKIQHTRDREFARDARSSVEGRARAGRRSIANAIAIARPARMCARVDVERASVDAIARFRSGAIRSVEIHSIVRARRGRRTRVGRVDARR